MECLSIARITSVFQSGKKAGTKFCTGILVSPTELLTCAHVVTEFEPRSPSPDDLDRVADEISIYFPAVMGVAEEVYKGTVYHYSKNDMAVIRLSGVSSRPPLQFESAPWILQTPEADRFVVGFDTSDSLAYSITKFRDAILFHSYSDTNAVKEFQTEGGISQGMSGSPLLSLRNGIPVGLAMVYLGGIVASNSRFAAAARILEFLNQVHIDAAFRGPFRVPFTQSFARTPGQLLKTQRDRKRFSRSELAKCLGVEEQVLESWERDRADIPEECKRSISTTLMEGDADAVNQWLRLAGIPDFLMNLAEFESSESSCELILERKRGVTTKHKPTQRICLPEGSLATIAIRLPQAAHALFFDVSQLESHCRSYTLIGTDNLSRQGLSAGHHILPRGGGRLDVTGPKGTNCLVMIAVAAGLQSPLAALAAETGNRELYEPELNSLLGQLMSLSPDQRWVSLCDYDIC